MKTKLFLALCICSLACSKGKDSTPSANCDSMLQKYETSLSTYATNPTAANCISFKTNIEDLVKKCTILTAQQRQEFNASLNTLTCN